MNGVVESVDARGFSVRVQQSFGNCPKYIVPREASFLARTPGEVVRSSKLDDVAVRMLRSADTFFIASAYPESEDGVRSHGVDVSHRGGEPGFIAVEDGVLKIPDYVGNYYFNTLGNLAVNPKAGLLVIDFETGDLLFLATTVEIVWEGDEVERVTGARRVLVMRVGEMVRASSTLRLRWSSEGAANLTAPLPQ